MDRDGDKVIASTLEKKRRLTVELREAVLFCEEENKGVVPLARGLLEAVERLPYPHAVACLVGRGNEASGGLHVTATVVWQGGLQEGGIDV